MSDFEHKDLPENNADWHFEGAPWEFIHMVRPPTDQPEISIVPIMENAYGYV